MKMGRRLCDVGEASSLCFPEELTSPQYARRCNFRVIFAG
jgi:hypothetical protein